MSAVQPDQENDDIELDIPDAKDLPRSAYNVDEQGFRAWIETLGQKLKAYGADYAKRVVEAKSQKSQPPSFSFRITSYQTWTYTQCAQFETGAVNDESNMIYMPTYTQNTQRVIECLQRKNYTVTECLQCDTGRPHLLVEI
jgi:hypothetical protein